MIDFVGSRNPHEMESQKSRDDAKSSTAAPTPAATSCRKKKNEAATFLEDLKDHVDEFIHASMDEHKTCFKKTIQKYLTLGIDGSGLEVATLCRIWMFGMSKIVAQRNDEQEAVESVLPLRTTVSQ